MVDTNQAPAHAPVRDDGDRAAHLAGLPVQRRARRLACDVDCREMSVLWNIGFGVRLDTQAHRDDPHGFLQVGIFKLAGEL